LNAWVSESSIKITRTTLFFTGTAIDGKTAPGLSPTGIE
jgi:hypothetical protein